MEGAKGADDLVQQAEGSADLTRHELAGLELVVVDDLGDHGVGVLCRETAEQHVAGHQGNKQHHGALAKAGRKTSRIALADKVCNGAHQVSTLTGVAHSHSTGNESADQGHRGRKCVDDGLHIQVLHAVNVEVHGAGALNGSSDLIGGSSQDQHPQRLVDADQLHHILEAGRLGLRRAGSSPAYQLGR